MTTTTADPLDDVFGALDAIEAAYEEGDPDTCADAVQHVLDAWARNREAARAVVDDTARFLLRFGYGIDYSATDESLLPPRGVLEAMVRLGSSEEEFEWIGADDEEVYYVLSSELGDWRNNGMSVDTGF